MDLAEEFGEDNLNAVQVYSGLVAEVDRSHQPTRLVRGQLVRELSESLPDGWPAVLDRKTRFPIAQAMGGWVESVVWSDSSILPVKALGKPSERAPGF